MKNVGASLAAVSALCAAYCIAMTGCGSDSNDGVQPAGGTTSQGGADSGTGGSGAAAASGGTSSGGGSSGGSAGSGGTGGAPPLEVPRISNTDGPSVLDAPLGPALGAGLCADSAVYCNGTCLATEGAAQGNCTAMKLGIGQAESVYLTAQSLFYTAANREILRMDLADGSHTSLVRGLEFPGALHVAAEQVYFSTDVPDAVFASDVRRVGVSGGDVWVLSPEFTEPIEFIETLGDRLLVGEGNFGPYDLWTLPIGGGAAESFGGIQATQIVLDGDTLYYRGDNYLSSTSVSAPAPDGFLNREFTNSRFVLEAGYLYHLYHNVYLRVPVGGGPMEEVQTFAEETYLLGRTSTSVILGRPDAVNANIDHLLTMPIAGGATTELVSYEANEWEAMAANDTHLYVAVGASRAGAILRVDL